MNYLRFNAIIKKEIFHILRDRRSFITAIILPIFLMFIYCESLSLDVNNIPMVIMDNSKTVQSRDLISRFTSSGYFTIIDSAENYRDLQTYINRSKAVMGLVIPYDFARKTKNAQGEIPVQIILDGSDPTRGSIANGYTSIITQNYSMDIVKKKLNNMGLELTNNPINPEVRVWYNPSLRSKNFLIPGLFAMIMAIFASLLTSMVISKEWETGTMELLISTPVKAVEVIFGKFVPYFVIGIVDSIVILIVSHFYYQVPVKGSWILLSFVLLLFLSGMLMIGLLISASFKSSLLSNQTAFMSTYLPTMLLSGFVFYIPGMPLPLQWISKIVPAKYFISSARGIFAKGVGIDVLWFNILFLMLFNAIVFVLALKKFNKTLDTD